MRGTILFILFYFSQIFCYAQKLEMNLDSIHPIIQHDQHGDSIRKYFSNTFYSHNSKFTEQNNLLISVFYSNKLAVNYNHVLKKIPQLKGYFNKQSKVYAQAHDSYAGAFTVPIFDSTGIIVTVNGINAQNAYKYQFRVLENNEKVLLPWTTPKIFTKAYWMTKIADSTKIDKVTAYLGQFKGDYGKSLTFQIRQTDNPDSIKTSLSAYWVKWQPRVVGVFTFSQLPEFLSIFKEQWKDQRGNEKPVDWSKDSTLLKLKKEFRYNENNLIFYLDETLFYKQRWFTFLQVPAKLFYEWEASKRKRIGGYACVDRQFVYTPKIRLIEAVSFRYL